MENNSSSEIKICPDCDGCGYDSKGLCEFCEGKGYYTIFNTSSRKDYEDRQLFD